MQEIITLGILTAIGGSILFSIYHGEKKLNGHRRDVYKRGLTPEHIKMLESLILYQRMPQELKEELQGKIAIFLDEKRFEGCAGLIVTDEMRVTVAAGACVLLLNKKSDCYPKLPSVILYPHAYFSNSHLCDGFVADVETVTLGESWDNGSLVLSWPDVKADSLNSYSPHHLVIHEFAHQLDQLDGIADGIPILESPADYFRWEAVMTDEFGKLRREADRGQPDVIDDYGATNPAEFFAVTTEAFFCLPHIMQQAHPDIYNELKLFYKLDPVTWALPEIYSDEILGASV